MNSSIHVPWTQVSSPITSEDIAACADINRRDQHFGFPIPDPSRFSAIWMTTDGRASDKPGMGKVGNYVTYRRLLLENPGAWLWAERYNFTHEPSSPDWADAQCAFIAALGEERLIEVERRARSLNLDPGGKTQGRPDIALYVPNALTPWRFIEIKRKGDRLEEPQKEWLRLLAEIFGKEAAIELNLIKTT